MALSNPCTTLTMDYKNGLSHLSYPCIPALHIISLDKKDKKGMTAVEMLGVGVEGRERGEENQ